MNNANTGTLLFTTQQSISDDVIGDIQSQAIIFISKKITTIPARIVCIGGKKYRYVALSEVLDLLHDYAAELHNGATPPLMGDQHA